MQVPDVPDEFGRYEYSPALTHTEQYEDLPTPASESQMDWIADWNEVARSSQLSGPELQAAIVSSAATVAVTAAEMFRARIRTSP